MAELATIKQDLDQINAQIDKRKWAIQSIEDEIAELRASYNAAEQQYALDEFGLVVGERLAVTEEFKAEIHKRNFGSYSESLYVTCPYVTIAYVNVPGGAVGVSPANCPNNSTGAIPMEMAQRMKAALNG